MWYRIKIRPLKFHICLEEMIEFYEGYLWWLVINYKYVTLLGILTVQMYKNCQGMMPEDILLLE